MHFNARSYFTTVCKLHLTVFISLFAERHSAFLSLISCFAGGVFLAACLLDIIPDYLSDMNSQIEVQKFEVRVSTAA